MKMAKKKKVEDDIELFNIEHSYIDFRYLILGQKLHKLHISQYAVQDELLSFDDFYLSMIIDNANGNELIFTQSSIKRVIDYQFKMTQPAVKVLFGIFMIFYYIPFLSTLFFEHPGVELGIYVFGAITNSLFFGIELIQMKHCGITGYFKESFWNIVEFS